MSNFRFSIVGPGGSGPCNRTAAVGAELGERHVVRQSPAARSVMLLLVLLLAALAVTPAVAQQTGNDVPRIESAERAFDQGVDTFEAGAYEEAYRRFRLIWQDYPLNRKTTAALLMGGRALYRQGAYEEAVATLRRLVDDYPTSSYVDAARRTIEWAREAQQAAARQPRMIDLGILLPMGPDTTALTQELFTGIRLAVDAFNEEHGEVQVRMIYRGTGRPGTVADSVRALVRDGADLIVGPLFSDTAVPAARAAEQLRTVLVAPLATDEAVSQLRDYVFQANPTITVRGREMAAFAARGLRMDTVGVVAERGSSIGERMARGFEQGAREHGLTVLFSERVPGSSAWYNLPSQLSADTLRRVEAVYMPISGRRAQRYIGAALTGLDRLGLDTRVLGNAEWHDLPLVQQASDHQVTYSNDFFVREGRTAVQQFQRRYREVAGQAPGRLAYTGYDLTRFLLSTLQDAEPSAYRATLREAPLFEGLGLRFDFDGGNVNHALFFHRYRFGRLDLLR